MTTFAARGIEVFPVPGPRLHRKRSHGRLKAYASCEDVRAWSNIPPVRQRHLIDVINAARTGYGNYIPLLELLKILGVPTTGVVLAEALKKLNKISALLGETDFQHPTLTSSEIEFRDLYAKRTGQCLEDDTVRNLRCLVSQLYERSKDFEEVKYERDRLKCGEREKDYDRCTKLLHLETERNCLQERLKVLEGIDRRMTSFMQKYEAAVISNRELKKELTKIASNARVEHEKENQIESEKDRLQNEVKILKRKLNILEKEKNDLILETSELRCSVADQEDEIDHLTSCINKLSSTFYCRMDQLQYALDQFQQEISDDLLEKIADEVEAVPMEEFDEKMTTLRDRLRNILGELKETWGFPDSPSICQKPKSKPLVDDRTRCDYLSEALAATQSKLQSLLNVQEEAARSRQELSNCQKKLEACEQLKKDYHIIQKENKNLKDSLEEMERDFRNLDKKCNQQGEEVVRKNAEPGVAEDSNAYFGVAEHSNAYVVVTEESNTNQAAAEDSNAVPAVAENSNAYQSVAEDSNIYPAAAEESNAVPTVAQDTNAVPTVARDLNTVPAVAADAKAVPTVAAESSAKVSDLNNCQELETRMAEKAREADNLKKLLEECTSKLEMQSQKLLNAEAQLMASNSPTGTDDGLTNRLRQMEQQLFDVNAKLKAAKEEVELKDKELNKSKSLIEDAEKKYKDVVNTGNNDQEKLNNIIQELNVCVTERKKEAEALSKQVNSLTSKLDDMTKEISDKDLKNSACSKEVNKLNDEITTLKTNLSECQRGKMELERELSNFEQTRKQLESQLALSKSSSEQLIAQIDKLKNELSESNLNINKLKEKNQYLEKDLEKALKSSDNKKRETAKLDEENAKDLIKLRDLVTENEKLTKEKEGLLYENNNMKKEITGMKKSLSECEDLNKSLQTKVSQCQVEIESQTKELTKRKSKLVEQSSGSNAQIEKLETDLKSSNAQIKSLENQLNRLKEDIEGYKKDAQTCKQELQSVKVQRDSEKEKADKLKVAFENLERINEACQKTLKDLNTQKNRAENELGTKTKEASKVGTERKSILGDMEKLKSKYEDCSNSLKEALQANETLKKQCHQGSDECENLNDELSKTTSQLKASEDKCKELGAKIQDLLEVEKNMREETIQLKNQLQGCKKVKESLENELDQCTENSKQIKAQLDKTKIDLMNLKAEKERYVGELNKLKEDMEQCQFVKEDNSEFIDHLTTKLKEKEMEMASLIEQCKVIQSNHDKVCAANGEMNKRCAEGEEQIKLYSKRVADLETNIEELKRNLGNVRKEKDRLIEKSKQASEEYCELSLVNNELNEKLNKSIREKNDMDLQLNVMIKEKGQLQKEFDELHLQVSLLMKDLLKIQMEDEKKSKEIEYLRKKVEEKDGIVNGLTIQLAQSDQEVENINDKNKYLAIETKNTKDALHRALAEKDNCLSSMKALGMKLEKCEDINHGLTRENDRLNVTIGRKDDEIRELKAITSVFNENLKERDSQLKERKKILEECLKNNNDLNLELEKTTDKVKKFENDIKGLRKTLLARDKEINTLNNTINDLDYKLQAGDIARQQLEGGSIASHNEIIHLKNDFYKCSESLKETSLLLNDAEVANRSLQVERESLTDRLAKMKGDMNDMENALKTYEINNKTLQNQFDLLTKDFDHLNNSYEQQSKDYNNLNEQYAALKKELLKSQEKLDTCQADNKNLINETKNLTETLQLTKSQCDELNEQHKLINHQLESNNQLLDNCQTAKKAKEDENDTLRRSLNKVTMELELKLSSLVACQKDADNLKVLAAQLERNTIVLKETVSKIGDENEELVQEVKSLKEQTAKLEAANSRLKTSIAEKDGTILNLNQEIFNNKEAAEGYKLSFENADKMLKKCTEEKNKVRKEMDSLQQQIRGLERIRNVLEDEINNCKNAGRKVSTEMDKIKFDYEALLESKHELNNELLISKAATNSLTESLRKIKDILNLVQREKENAEDSLRKLATDNLRCNEELEDAKRKLKDAEYSLTSLQSKLKNEMIESSAKQNSIKCLQDEVKFVSGKLIAREKELMETKMERDNLLSDIVQLKQDIHKIKDSKPANTPINNILNRIMKNGFEACKLEELSELHEAVIEGTEAMIKSGRGRVAPPSNVVSVEPKPRPLTEEAKNFILKLGPIQKQLARSQHQAKKRSCALMENLQNYQHELNALRAWDVELSNKLKRDEPIEDSVALQLRASQYQQSKLAHLIAASSKKQKETATELQNLSNALDKIETAQNQAINNQLSEQALKIAECMKYKLDEAEKNEKMLQCLLQQEIQKSATLENSVRTKQSPQTGFESKREPVKTAHSKQCPPFPWTDDKSVNSRSRQQDPSYSQRQNKMDCSDKRRSVSFCDEVETKMIDDSLC